MAGPAPAPYSDPQTQGDEVWAGDDGAVVVPPAGARVVAAVDPMVEGVHFDLASDRSRRRRMEGGRPQCQRHRRHGAQPWRCLVSVVAPEGTAARHALRRSSRRRRAMVDPVVGGDLAGGRDRRVRHGPRPPRGRPAGASDGMVRRPVIASSSPENWAGEGRPQRAAGRCARAVRTLVRETRSHPWRRRSPRSMPARPRASMSPTGCRVTSIVSVWHQVSASRSRLRSCRSRLGRRSMMLLHGGDEYVLAYTLPPGRQAPGWPRRDRHLHRRPDERALDGQRFEVGGWEHEV